jgi:small subunit ribosomal protein S5
MIKATFDALTSVASPRSVAARRGKKVGERVGRRDAGGEGRAEPA